MVRHEIRDKNRILLGWLQQSGNRVEGRDKHGGLKGYYDPRSDETRDRSGYFFGKGNLLAVLITGKA